jgi:hypothetical protein
VITARPANPEHASLRLEVRVLAGDVLERYLRFSAAQTSTEKATESADPAPVLDSAPSDAGIEAHILVPVVLGGLTAISAGVALAFTAKASAANAAATDWALRTGGNCNVPSAACAGLADARERRNDANRIANVAWVSTGVFGLSTLATVLLWPKGTAPVAGTNLRVAPYAGDGMRGVLVMGRLE